MNRLCRLLAFSMIAIGMILLPCSAEEDASQLRLLFVGDIMLDNGPGHLISNGQDPFEACAELLTSPDLTIGNLECVVGRQGDQLNKAYTFRAASDSPRYIKKYFDAVSLANNHSWDYGAEGFSESLRVLKSEGILHFGGGNNIREARAPLILECKGKKIGLLGYNEFRASNYAATENASGNAPMEEQSVLADIRTAKEDLGCDIVIPFLHWGEELYAAPRLDQKRLARKWIDAGATAIIGAHPHVTETIDIYRGAPIVYSLGNFVFDYYPGDPSEWTGWCVELRISQNGAIDVETTVVALSPTGVPTIVVPE